jgi:hypothetical protein
MPVACLFQMIDDVSFQADTATQKKFLLAQGQFLPVAHIPSTTV